MRRTGCLRRVASRGRRLTPREDVGSAREREEQVAEPIEVDDDLAAAPEPSSTASTASLGPAADRARHVKRRGLRRAAGEHEGLERLARGVRIVDGALEPLRCRACPRSAISELRLPARHARELRPQREEIFLDAREDRVDHAGQPAWRARRR